MSSLYPAVVPASNLAKIQQALIATLALSSTFQQRVGGANQDDAANFIFRTFLRSTDIEGVPRPCAIIEQGDYMTQRVDLQHLRPDAELSLILTDWDNVPDDLDASTVDFQNFFGGVIDDLGTLQGQDANLCIESISVPAADWGLAHPAAGDARPYWFARLHIKVSNK